MTAFTIYPDNPLEIETEIPVFDTTTRKEIPLTAGTVTAFLASSNLNGATAIDPSVSVTMLAPLTGKKKWLAKFAASVMTFPLLNGMFGKPPVAGLVLTSLFENAPDSAIAVPPYASAFTRIAWSLQAGTWGIRNGKAYGATEDPDPTTGGFAILSADTGVMSWDVTVVLGAIGVEFALQLGSDVITTFGGITVECLAGVLIVYSQTIASNIPTPRAAFEYHPQPGDTLRVLLTQDSTLTIWINGTLALPAANGFTADQRPGSLLSLYVQDTVMEVASVQVMTAPVPDPYIVLTMANGFREVIGPGQYLETKVAEISA